jgi:transcriptional regulator
MSSDSIEVVQGTLEFLILQTLSGAEAMHGFEVLEWIYEATNSALKIEEGSLYPALHRMEKRGLVAATWGVSPKGRRAKYYALTKAGEVELADQQKRWNDYVVAVDKICSATGDSR